MKNVKFMAFISSLFPVTAETPTDLKWLKENATLTWSFKAFRDFPPGLVHEVKVCTQGYPELPCDVKVSNIFLFSQYWFGWALINGSN